MLTMQDKNGEEIRWGISGINVALQIVLDGLYLVSFCAQLVLTAFYHFHGPRKWLPFQLTPTKATGCPHPFKGG